MKDTTDQPPPQRPDNKAMIERGAQLFAEQVSECPICGVCKSEARVRNQLAREFGVDESSLVGISNDAGALYEARREAQGEPSADNRPQRDLLRLDAPRKPQLRLVK